MEDDPLQREILTSVFASQCLEVETAANGLDALWKVRERKYDLVLCDYKLPELNGFAMARLIRDLMGADARPVLIALTGSPASLASKGATAEGAFDEVIPKPVDLGHLMSAVQRHLDARLDAAMRRDAEFGRVTSPASGDDADPGSTAGRGDPSAPLRILVVEDDEMQQSALRAALGTRGFAVEIACDGLQAVRMIRDGAFDLVLLDYHLPEMDGLATGRLIHGLLEGSRPRMIAFTSTPGHLTHRLAGTRGAFDEIVAKSDGLPVLLETIERHLWPSPSSAVPVVFPSAARV